MDILFLAFNTTIFIQYAKLLSRWGITRSAERFIFAYFLLMIQIIASLLFLGAIGCLYPLPAVAANAMIILFLSFFTHAKRLDQPYVSNWKMWKVILTPLSNKLIAAYSFLILCWLLACAYYLPPRVADEITYHLPFIYESIQRGHWALLPLDLRIHFAYPMNAEVLFSWPVLFMGDTRWVDASQIPVGVWTSGIIYLFARHFGLHRTRAFFLAGIFFLTPIVIAQMGTDYIDVVSAGFLICSLYLTMRFLKTSQKIYVKLAFLSIGTMMGIKYHLLFWGLILAFILFFILFNKDRKKEFLWGFLSVMLLGLGWHLRNLWLFSDWFYPARVTAQYWDLGGQSALAMFISIVNKITLTFGKGINNGTVDGGFGLFYGLFIIISWIWGSWIFIFRKGKWRKIEILYLGIALSFLLIILPIGIGSFRWIGPRILLAAWPIYLLIFGRIIFVINKKTWIQRTMIVIFFIGFALDTKAVVTSPWPEHYWWAKSKMSEFESYRFSNWYVKQLDPITGDLDVLTQFLSRQATVYLAAPSGEFFSAPFYGRFLQTRIINFDPQFKGDPDFLVYWTVSRDPLVYIGKYRKTLPEAFSSKYIRIFLEPHGIIFAHPRIFKAGICKNSL